jgi:hypothetical protein
MFVLRLPACSWTRYLSSSSSSAGALSSTTLYTHITTPSMHLCYQRQCCGSEKIFFGLGSKIFFLGFGYGFGFNTSGKGNINFFKYRQSVFHEDVLVKLKFLPA